MPYIPQERRQQLLDGAPPEKEGELNFVISYLINEYATREAPSYGRISQAIAAARQAATEAERVLLAPLENLKHEQNGRVFAEPVRGPGDSLHWWPKRVQA